MIESIFLFLGIYTHIVGTEDRVITDRSLIATLFVLLYFFIDLNPKWQPKGRSAVKLTLIVLILTYTVGATMLEEIKVRHIVGPNTYIYDHPLQVEEGLKFLRAKKNPYSESYEDTALGNWDSDLVRFAFPHFISLPTHLYVSLPIYIASETLLGWYDQRFVHILFFVLALLSLYQLIETPQIKRLGLIAIGLNPLFAPYFIRGTDDIMFLGSILFSLLLLKKQRVAYSLIAFAVAVTMKQTAWIAAPFYFFYLFTHKKLYAETKKWFPLFAVLIILSFTPFIIWDARSFYEDIYAYPAGNLSTSYPIRGIGIPGTLVNLGVIKDSRQHIPFGVIQLIFGLPLLYFLLKRLSKTPTLGNVLLGYGVFLWVFWMLGRFFNASYAGVLMVILAAGVLLHYDYQQQLQRKKHGGIAQSVRARDS